MIEIVLNSSILGQVIGMGIGYVMYSSFFMLGTIIFCLDLVLLSRGYAMRVYLLHYAAALLLVIILYMLPFMYPVTVNIGSTEYIVNPVYMRLQTIISTIFFGIFAIKALLVLILRLSSHIVKD